MQMGGEDTRKSSFFLGLFFAIDLEPDATCLLKEKEKRKERERKKKDRKTDFRLK